jgi:hypothetical protein
MIIKDWYWSIRGVLAVRKAKKRLLKLCHKEIEDKTTIKRLIEERNIGLPLNEKRISK